MSVYPSRGVCLAYAEPHWWSIQSARDPGSRVHIAAIANQEFYWSRVGTILVATKGGEFIVLLGKTGRQWPI